MMLFAAREEELNVRKIVLREKTFIEDGRKNKRIRL
jgi:hypothetical protein